MKINDPKPTRCNLGNTCRTRSIIKENLKRDFNHRCAYCGDHDFHAGGSQVYHIEHFAPKSIFPELMYCYDNLLYACPFCNRSKSNTWIGNTSDENVVGDKGFVDPCCDEYDDHLERNEESGKIFPKTELGKYMHRKLRLYLLRHELIFKMEELHYFRRKLESTIDKLDEASPKREKLERAYFLLSRKFFKYYDNFREEVG